MMYLTFTMQMLFRLLTFIVAPILLIIPTLYATARKLDRLPWGLDGVFGCVEDGWNGNGIDPDNPRQYYNAGEWDVERADENGEPAGTQGWWPNYKRVNWAKLSFIKEWWLSYQWCALRNVCFNLRFGSFIGENIHYNAITLKRFEWQKSLTKPIRVEWINENGSKRFFRVSKIGNFLVTWGWEFYPWTQEPTFSSYKRLRKQGYYNVNTQKDSKYKDRSIVSVRLTRL